LVVTKDKELVFPKRTAGRAAELFALEGGSRVAGVEIERVGIEDLIAEVSERRTVDAIGPRLYGVLEDGSAGTAELGRSD